MTVFTLSPSDDDDDDDGIHRYFSFIGRRSFSGSYTVCVHVCRRISYYSCYTLSRFYLVAMYFLSSLSLFFSGILGSARAGYRSFE